MAPSRRSLSVAAACAALAVAGCGGSDQENEASSPTPTPSAAAAMPQPTATPRKPKVPHFRGKPPKRLVKRDLKVGNGPTASPGHVVQVQYVGVSYTTGRQFDASWDRHEPFSFQLGAGQVIPGWDKGVAGMKVGGRRVLVIPPDQAYGPQGSPPAIGPNETLVFVIDLLAVQ
jgi:peptidylprolyl isomerase